MIRNSPERERDGASCQSRGEGNRVGAGIRIGQFDRLAQGEVARREVPVAFVLRGIDHRAERLDLIGPHIHRGTVDAVKGHTSLVGRQLRRPQQSSPASIAGLPGSRAIVCVGPPWSCKPAGSSRGSTPTWLPSTPLTMPLPAPVPNHVVLGGSDRAHVPRSGPAGAVLPPTSEFVIVSVPDSIPDEVLNAAAVAARRVVGQRAVGDGQRAAAVADGAAVVVRRIVGERAVGDGQRAKIVA